MWKEFYHPYLIRKTDAILAYQHILNNTPLQPHAEALILSVVVSEGMASSQDLVRSWAIPCGGVTVLCSRWCGFSLWWSRSSLSLSLSLPHSSTIILPFSVSFSAKAELSLLQELNQPAPLSQTLLPSEPHQSSACSVKPLSWQCFVTTTWTDEPILQLRVLVQGVKGSHTPAWLRVGLTDSENFPG